MKPARWYFDYISPFAYLQWRRLSSLRDRLVIEPVPILFAAILDKLGTKGPAETPDKRRFTYRFVDWRARRDGVPLKFPPAHPFNPLPALRLSVALGNTDEAIDALFAHLWQHGGAADSASLAPVAAAFGIDDVAQAIDDRAVKSTLRDNTERAIASGVFGVPTLEVDGEMFWGDDATEMALAHLDGTLVGDRDEWARLSDLPVGVSRF